MTTFTIGPWTFHQCPNTRLNKMWVKVYLGDEHIETLDAVWPTTDNSAEMQKEIHRAAAYWIAQQATSILEMALPIMATGILR